MARRWRPGCHNTNKVTAVVDGGALGKGRPEIAQERVEARLIALDTRSKVDPWWRLPAQSADMQKPCACVDFRANDVIV